MSFIEHAKRELDIIGMTADSPDEMNLAMREHILHMVEEFAKEGHSGFSSSYALSILQKLLAYEPLAPLTGEDSEWNDVTSYGNGDVLYQNKRCSHVFKDSTGAWDIDGIVLVYPDGGKYMGPKLPVTFPYTPKKEYVNVDENGVAI